MRYRLRTLMIVTSLACMYLAWAGYYHRMSAFHRHQSSQLLTLCAKCYGFTRERLEKRISENPRFVDEGHYSSLYASAAASEVKARKYDRAACYVLGLVMAVGTILFAGLAVREEYLRAKRCVKKCASF